MHIKPKKTRFTGEHMSLDVITYAAQSVDAAHISPGFGLGCLSARPLTASPDPGTRGSWPVIRCKQLDANCRYRWKFGWTAYLCKLQLWIEAMTKGWTGTILGSGSAGSLETLEAPAILARSP